ncbi:hypothetical protein CNQ82_09610 [Staphylococcus debuckii]|nr:hypothetical protein CNQ82_09610 [Staphylococcus debuckii]
MMKNKIIKNLSISVVAAGFLFPCAHLNASAAESQNNNEVPQVNTATEDNSDESQQNSSQKSRDIQNQGVQPPNKPEINNGESDPATNVPKQDDSNNPSSPADDNHTSNKEEASHPDSSGAQVPSNNGANGNQTQNPTNHSEETDENATGSKPNTTPNNNENNSAGENAEEHQPNESKPPANNTKNENAEEPNQPNAPSNGQENGNARPTNTGEHNETTKPNQQPGNSEEHPSNVDPNDGKGGSGSHSTHVKNDGSEKEGAGTAQPNKEENHTNTGTEQPDSPNPKKDTESTNEPKQPQPPKGNQNPKAPSQNHQTPTRRPQPDLNKDKQQDTNTTGRKENNYYKEKNGYTKLPNNSNKVPTKNWNNYPYAKTSGATEQQNKKHPNRNSWKGNFYNNLTQPPTQQKASDKTMHKASQYLVPFTTMNLAGNRFGHIVTGSFKYNPFVINQVSRMSEDSNTTEGDIHSALEHQNFASNRDLNNLQESTGYFKYQFFNPTDAQQYYDNLDVQVLGLITGDIGSMPDLKRTKKSANFEVGSTNHAKDYSEKIDNTKEEGKETKTESEKIEKGHPRLIATLLATFGAAFIWFIILMIIHRRNDENQEKED